MSKVTITSFEEYEKYLGKEIGVSEYIEVTQEQINLFADATLDHQWIHTDPARAAVESPFKSTIAHGYFNLSILPYLWLEIVEFKNVKLMVNYGIEKLKFNQPVLIGSKIRLRAKLESLVNLRGTTKAALYVVLEIEGNNKPALDGVLTFLYHFNN
ncbi:MAG TPA: MaoC family dehydratase [Bacteroidales bacterium]|jgi:acyl dehydratase|nr:MaoC family dehydratase [Bacteroidales bacterium]